MNVLMIAPQPFFQPRGTPFSVLHRLRALSTLGHKVDLVTYHLGQNVEINGVRIMRAASLPGVKEIAIGPSKTKILLDILVYRRAVMLLQRHRYDLIHTHEEAGFFGGRLSRRFHTLHLYDMHSSLPQQLSNFRYSRSRVLRRTFEKLESQTVNSADAVITICPELCNYVKAHFPYKFNQLIENLGDNSSMFERRVEPDDLKRQYSLNGHPVVLYTGTLEPYQGLNLLIEAGRQVVARHPNVRFLIVGGKPEQVAINRSHALTNGVANNFIFTGQRPPEEIPAFLKLASLLVSPRLQGNNTPLKIYEYLRSGKPIIATDHVTHTQVLNPQVAKLTACESESFAQGIVAVLDDNDLGRKLGAEAQALAEREYSYDAYLRKTQEVYDYLEQKLTDRSLAVTGQ